MRGNTVDEGLRACVWPVSLRFRHDLAELVAGQMFDRDFDSRVLRNADRFRVGVTQLPEIDGRRT